jgi:hypothetical protein
MLCRHGLLLLYIWAKIACKLGHIVNVNVDDVMFKPTSIETIIEI